MKQNLFSQLFLLCFSALSQAQTQTPKYYIHNFTELFQTPYCLGTSINYGVNALSAKDRQQVFGPELAPVFESPLKTIRFFSLIQNQPEFVDFLKFKSALDTHRLTALYSKTPGSLGIIQTAITRSQRIKILRLETIDRLHTYLNENSDSHKSVFFQVAILPAPGEGLGAAAITFHSLYVYASDSRNGRYRFYYRDPNQPENFNFFDYEKDTEKTSFVTDTRKEKLVLTSVFTIDELGALTQRIVRNHTGSPEPLDRAVAAFFGVGKPKIEDLVLFGNSDRNIPVTELIEFIDSVAQGNPQKQETFLQTLQEAAQVQRFLALKLLRSNPELFKSYVFTLFATPIDSNSIDIQAISFLANALLVDMIRWDQSTSPDDANNIPLASLKSLHFVRTEILPRIFSLTRSEFFLEGTVAADLFKLQFGLQKEFIFRNRSKLLATQRSLLSNSDLRDANTSPLSHHKLMRALGVQTILEAILEGDELTPIYLAYLSDFKTQFQSAILKTELRSPEEADLIEAYRGELIIALATPLTQRWSVAQFKSPAYKKTLAAWYREWAEFDRNHSAKLEPFASREYREYLVTQFNLPEQALFANLCDRVADELEKQ